MSSTFDGVNPVVGASICLRAASANALLRCEKAGSEITYDVHTYDSRKWKIVKKKSGGDNHLRIGDEIMIQNVMLANAQNPNNKAKKAQDVGIKEDTAKKKIVGHIQKSHYLLIVKV